MTYILDSISAEEADRQSGSIAMSEMVERVAMAIAMASLDADELPISDELLEVAYKPLARAALAAMREPTDNMCAVADGIHFPDNIWRAMIQEALEP